MLTKIFNFLLVAGAIQGFLFVIIPLLLKKKIGKPIWFLNGLVLFISLNNLQAWIIEKGLSSSVFFIKNLEIPWYMLVAPFFYSFLIYYLNIQDKKKTFLRLSLAIFIGELIIRIGLITYSERNSLDASLIKNYTKIEEILNLILTVFLFIKAVLILFKHENLHESIITFDNIHWIKQLIIFGSIIISLWLIAVLANIFIENNNQQITYYPLRLSSSLLIYWIGYQGLIRYNLLQDRISLRKEIGDSVITLKLEENNSGFENDKQKESFDKVENYLIEHKRYLDPLVSLSGLAQESNMSTSHLSKLINTYSKSHFTDYINKLRIERSKSLLSDSQFKNYTIVSIGFECGFNSKSTFYTAFKKFTGVTPTEYRKNYDSK